MAFALDLRKVIISIVDKIVVIFKPVFRQLHDLVIQAYFLIDHLHFLLVHLRFIDHKIFLKFLEVINTGSLIKLSLIVKILVFSRLLTFDD